MEHYRQSISTNNIFDKDNGCPFQFYLQKIAGEPEEPSDIPRWGPAGTLTHEALEDYYKNQINKLPGTERKSELDRIKKEFDDKWVENQITKLNKKQYWDCVLNGINDDWVPTHTEEFVNIEAENYSFVAKIDARKGEEWVLDYKTSTFSYDKVKEYFHQLVGYAFAIRRKHGFYPKKLVVMFLKQNQKSKTYTHVLKYTEDDSKDKSKYYSTEDVFRFAKELSNNQLEYERRVEKMDWIKNKSNCFFCNYKNLCYNGNAGTLKFTLLNKDNIIYLRPVDTVSLPKILLDKMDERMSYSLPEEQKKFAIEKLKEKTGRDWDGIFHLFDRNKISFKRGFVDEVKNILNHFARATRKTLIIREDRTSPTLPKGKYPNPFKLNFPYLLYQYQKEAVYHALKSKVGIIKLPTGSGKSIVAAEIIRRLNTKSLYIIDNKELLEQTKEDYEELLQMEVGTITDGDFNPKQVTVATIQTIARAKMVLIPANLNLEDKEKLVEKNRKAKEIQDYLATVNLVLADEAQIWASESFKYLNKHLVNNEYMIATTATPKRTDGHDMLLEERCGKVIYEKTIDELVELGLFKRPKVTMYKVPPIEELETVTQIINGVEAEVKATWRDNYNVSIVNNEWRNNKILDIVEQNKGKQILITATTHEHLKLLNELIPNSKLVHGKTAKKKRKTLIDGFKNGDFDILIAQSVLLFKGLNINKLELLINAAGHRSDISTTQLIGRLNRKHPEGNEKYYVDFLDSGTEFERASIRYTTLKNDLGYEIELK